MSGSTIRSLRILIVADWVLVLVGVPLALLLEPSLPPELREFLALEQEKPFGIGDFLQDAAMLLTITLWLVGSVGTLLLRRWARPIYLAAVVTGVMFTPFVGPTVLPPLAAAIDETSLIISGSVLGILYFSGVREQLRPTSATATDAR